MLVPPFFIARRLRCRSERLSCGGVFFLNDGSEEAAAGVYAAEKPRPYKTGRATRAKTMTNAGPCTRNLALQILYATEGRKRARARMAVRRSADERVKHRPWAVVLVVIVLIFGRGVLRDAGDRVSEFGLRWRRASRGSR